MAPGKRRALDPKNKRDRLLEKIEKLKASARAKVEHPFRVAKQQFGYAKVRYRGLAKNTARLSQSSSARSRRQGDVLTRGAATQSLNTEIAACSLDAWSSSDCAAAAACSTRAAFCCVTWSICVTA